MGVSRRGQSEVIGIVLLVGVVTVLVVAAGAVVLSDLAQNDEEALATIESNVSATNVTLEMKGGDQFRAVDIDIIVRNGSEARLNLASNFTLHRGTTNRTLEPGDRWQDKEYDPPSSGEFTLFVVDTDSGTLLHEKRYVR